MKTYMKIEDVREILKKMEAIAERQAHPHMHPLTCGNDKCRDILYPAFDGKKVVLSCPSCDYNQKLPG